MWVRLNSDIFDDKSNLRDVRQLITFAFEGSRDINIIKIKLLAEYDKVKDTELFQELDSIDQDLLISIFVDSYYRDDVEAKYNVTNNGNISNNFTLEEAKELFKESFSIVLENSKNDSPFVKAILHHFASDKAFINHAIDKRWITFEHAGGSSSVVNFIKGKLNPFLSLSSKNNASPYKYFRGIVIVDSDKKYPEAPENGTTKSIRTYLSEQNIPLHVLNKRSMENYIPDETILNVRQQKNSSKRTEDKKCVKWINVYEHLNPKIKDFLKYEGISESDFSTGDLNNLFLDIGQNQRDILIQGINYKNFELEEDEINFKNSFPLLFSTCNLVNKMTLNDRCGSNELQDLSTKINELL